MHMFVSKLNIKILVINKKVNSLLKMGKRFEDTLCKRRCRNSQQTHEKFPPLLLITEIQIKTTVR